MKTYREKLLDIEKELDLKTFTYKGLKIWPLIRLSIILDRPKTNKVMGGSFTKRLKFLGIGIVEFLKWKLGLWPKSKNIFLSSSHYKVKEQGVWYDRIIDPFLSRLKEKGEDYVVFDYTNNFSYATINYSERRIRTQPVIYLLSFVWRIQYHFSNIDRKLEGDIELFNRTSERHDLSFRIDDNFRRRLFMLEKQSRFFEDVLSGMSAVRVGLVCYYDFKSLALIWASHRLGIFSMDIQHGVQHSLHLAYSKWSKSISENSVFIPSHFYVWDQYSFNNISQWHDSNKIIIGGNKWIEDRISFTKRNIILFTLQPLEDPIPSHFVEAIKNYTGDKWIFIRLHPQQLVEYTKIEKFLKENNILHKVNIKDATYKPLTDILSLTAIHITKSSSVAIEASYFNIPTVFINARGRDMYETMLPRFHHLFAEDPGKIISYVNDLKMVTERNRMDNLPSDQFHSIDRFYNLH